MKCENCGSNNPKSSAACIECGAKMNGAAKTAKRGAAKRAGAKKKVAKRAAARSTAKRGRNGSRAAAY